jgi:hypothetical protein
MVVLGSTIMIRDTGSSSSKVFKRGASKARMALTPVQSRRSAQYASETMQAQSRPQDDVKSKGSTFTFKNVCYTVQVAGEERRLLVR